MKTLLCGQKGFLSFIELVIAIPILLLLAGGTFSLIQLPLAKRDFNKAFYSVFEDPEVTERFPAGYKFPDFVPTPGANTPASPNPTDSGVLSAATAQALFNNTACPKIQDTLNTEISPLLVGISNPGRIAVQLAFVRFSGSQLTMEFIAKSSANSGICSGTSFDALSAKAGALDWKAVADNLVTSFRAQTASLSNFGLVPVVGTNQNIPSTWLIAVGLMEVSQPIINPFGSGNRIVSATYVKPVPNPAAFESGVTYAP